MKNLPVIFFDLGNTLIKFHGEWLPVLQDSTRSLTACLWEMGYEIDQEEFIQSFGRHVLTHHVRRDINMVEESAESILEDELRRYGFFDVKKNQLRRALDCMFAVSQEYWQPYEDSIPMLELLRSQGYRLAIISNAKDCEDVHQLLYKAKFDPFFETVTISCEIGYRKPHPKIFKAALKKMNVRAKHSVMVGDLLEADVAGANDMGMKSIWMNPDSKDWKLQHLPSARPDFIITALSEIPTILNKINQ